jgi:hypothetical protein
VVALIVDVQTGASNSSSTSGHCSPAMSGSHNRITLACTDEASQQAIIKILKRISDHQLNPQTVLEKLDEIIATQRQQSVTLDSIQTHLKRPTQFLANSEIYLKTTVGRFRGKHFAKPIERSRSHALGQALTNVLGPIGLTISFFAPNVSARVRLDGNHSC